METLKVSSKSDPNRVAGALANVLRDKGSAEIQSIGAGALNQAIKAVAIARGFVAPSGKNLVCIPAFTDIVIDGDERTAIKLIVESNLQDIFFCYFWYSWTTSFSFNYIIKNFFIQSFNVLVINSLISKDIS